jgi:hypothetical protein
VTGLKKRLAAAAMDVFVAIVVAIFTGGVYAPEATKGIVLREFGNFVDTLAVIAVPGCVVGVDKNAVDIAVLVVTDVVTPAAPRMDVCLPTKLLDVMLCIVATRLARSVGTTMLVVGAAWFVAIADFVVELGP